MYANFATALPTGAAMTFLILFGMQALIAMQPGAAVETPEHPIRPWLYVPPEEDLHKQDFKPENIPEFVPPPVQRTDASNHESAQVFIPVNNPPPGPREEQLINYGFTDGPLVAVIRVSPTYPSSMIAKGIEGFVTVVFDVLPDGSVSNVSVIESSHKGFERSAIQAAGRFRFKARVVDGVPQSSNGIQYRVTYEMDK
jgi:protein TonB